MPVLTAPSAPTHEVGSTKFTSLATPSKGTVSTAMWSVEIAPGTPPTPHSLTSEELFTVIAGTAHVKIAETEEVANVGDVIVIPADVVFVLSNPTSEPLRMLCCLPVGGQARLADGSVFTPPWAQ